MDVTERWLLEETLQSQMIILQIMTKEPRDKGDFIMERAKRHHP